MTDYITPIDYVSMFGLESKDDADTFFMKNFITFTAYNSPVINYTATSSRNAITPSSKIMSYSFYYPKNSIREDTSHAFSANEGALADTIRQGKEIFREALIGTKVVKATSSTTGVLTDEATYFTHTEKRKFSIILDLYSTSNSQEDIYRPIFFFKKYSHASTLSKEGSIVQFIQFPSTFTITGGVFSNPAVMPQSNGLPYHLMLKNISVEYNTEMQFLDVSGYPLQAKLSLDFEEIKTLFQEDYAKDINDLDIVKSRITINGKAKGA